MFKNKKKLKFLFFILCFSVFSSISQTNEDVPLNNIVINEEPKLILPIIFEDFSGNKVNLGNHRGKLVIINFWATWCAPCKKEMPSLDKLYQNKNFKNLQVLAVNIEKPNPIKVKKFFKTLNIKNLKIFFDSEFKLTKTFKLRGVPTTILINKKGEEFARIVGSIDFENKKFVKWLSNYD
jgi:thiol-disulfide isomerase/thioredoxin